MKRTENFQMVAKTMAELEDVLAEELIELGANDVETGIRMVSFTGNNALLYKANLHCRTALRILKPIHTFVANNADEVYEEIKKIDWEQYLTLDKTFSIDAVVFSHIFRHSKFVSYRVKDGIVDYFSERYEKRPSVSVTNPDLMFNIHIAHNKCTLSLDSSGESLHKRGYRIAQTDAPLNEVLAAGMILKSGWRGESTFIDPMCGSGTLLIEAAMIALNIPPGIHRDSFAFEKWNDFDKDLFSEIYNDDSGAKTFDYKIIGTDISGQAISIAEKNVKNAGLKNQITLEIKPFQQYTKAPEPAGILMTNPPYGERIRVDDIEALYNMIGERLKHVFAGYDAYVLSFKKENFDNIGLKPAERFFLFNGPLECEMRKYEIFAGKRDDRKKEEVSARRYDRDNRSIGENKREFKQDFANRAGSSNRGSKRSRDEGRERGGFKEKGSRWDKDKGPSGDRNRGSDRDRKSHSDYKSYDRKKVVYDDATNRPVFIKRDPEDYQQKRKRVDLKKRKSENSEEAPGAEKRVNKVFIARKHPTKRKDSESDVNKETNSDNE
ncbi:MAG: THUMP domain-containing protein [Dysgonamonadaceae bacterium]|jgi:putative N6-adenine-specific DNA methylase|nr:THUMP domain-containing protein [Dysgonamonadaceae bacterium]MDD3726902.1 THUMP domain-containing protein [Dysgonamonadaceae bacterium]HUI32054.1 THUMP domain-containing protein [Dysgonamonadaceae bacterium]